MTDEERKELETIRHLLDRGGAEEAFHRLKSVMENASEELRARDMWQVHELFGACFHDFGDPEGAAQAYFRAAQEDRFLRSQRQHISSYLFALHYLPGISDEEMARQNFAYGALYREEYPFSPKGPIRGKIRVGYLSPSFSEQSTARFYETMLTEYDREQFQVYCYGLSTSEDAFSNGLREGVDGWREFSEDRLEEVPACIRQDEIDILFDLGGHSEGGRTLMVMAGHPAPVQISGIGWIDTTGLPAMDYFLTDGDLVPSGYGESSFCEKLLRLSRAFCWKPTEKMRRILRGTRKKGSPPRLGVFNNFMKVTEDMLHLWRSILEELPGATLVLQDTCRHPARQKRMEERVQEAGLWGRTEIRLSSPNYLEQLANVDLLLDTYPYTGGGMTAVALYLGTPVITLAGTRHGSRFGKSLLYGAGLPQLVANNSKEYVAKSVELAGDEEWLECLHLGLRQQLEDSALMDGKGYMRELEKAYRGLVHRTENNWTKDAE